MFKLLELIRFIEKVMIMNMENLSEKNEKILLLILF